MKKIALLSLFLLTPLFAFLLLPGDNPCGCVNFVEFEGYIEKSGDEYYFVRTNSLREKQSKYVYVFTPSRKYPIENPENLILNDKLGERIEISVPFISGDEPDTIVLNDSFN